MIVGTEDTESTVVDWWFPELEICGCYVKCRCNFLEQFLDILKVVYVGRRVTNLTAFSTNGSFEWLGCCQMARTNIWTFNYDFGRRDDL